MRIAFPLTAVPLILFEARTVRQPNKGATVAVQPDRDAATRLVSTGWASTIGARPGATRSDRREDPRGSFHCHASPVESQCCGWRRAHELAHTLTARGAPCGGAHANLDINIHTSDESVAIADPSVRSGSNSNSNRFLLCCSIAASNAPEVRLEVALLLGRSEQSTLFSA